MCFGDGFKVIIKKKCIIRLKYNSYKLIFDIYYISELRSYILSMRKLLEINCKISMEDKIFCFVKEKVILLVKLL